jgi:hypothetical protein
VGGIAGDGITGKVEGEETGEVRGAGIMAEGSKESKAGGRAP